MRLFVGKLRRKTRKRSKWTQIIVAELGQDGELRFMARDEEKAAVPHVGKSGKNRQQPNRVHVLCYRVGGRSCCSGISESTLTNGEANRDAATIRGDTAPFPKDRERVV